MADIFISYAHEDRDAVRELAHRLTRAGFSSWWDREIAVGEDLTQVIESKLESARAVIVVWSAASVRSTWVIGEANVGLESGKLVPIQIQEASIPLPFRMCQTADMRGWPTESNELQFHKLMLSVKARVTGESIDENDARASADRLDPTVSVRIANRVKQALAQSQPSAGSKDLELRLNLETAMTDFALDVLKELADPQLLPRLLAKLEPILRSSYINVWENSNQIYGWDSRGLDLAEALGEHSSLLLSEETPDADGGDAFSMNGLRWAFAARSQEVTLSTGSMYSDSPVPEVLERLERLCELVANYRHRQSAISPESAED
jgi:hypothetical protein